MKIAYVTFAGAGASSGKEYAYFCNHLVPIPGRPCVVEMDNPPGHLKIVTCTRVADESPPNPKATKEIFALFFTQDDAQQMEGA